MNVGIEYWSAQVFRARYTGLYKCVKMGLFLGNFMINAIVEITALKNPVSANSEFSIVTCLYLAKNGISISHQLYS